MKKTHAVVVLWWLITPLWVSALSPVILLSGGAGGSWVASDDETVYFPYYSGGISGGYRTALENGGYFAGALVTDFRFYRGDIDDLDDRYLVSLDAGIPVGPNRLDVGLELDSSIHNLGAGLLLAPAWFLDFLVLGDGATPRLGYFGSYRRQGGAVDDRLEQGIRLGFDRDRSIYFGWGLEAVAAWVYFPEWSLLDTSGAFTSDRRQDTRLELSATLEGLIGFFSSWDLTVESGLLYSTANRWIPGDDAAGDGPDDEGTLEKRSQDRVFAGISGGLQLSPHRNIGMGGTVALKYDRYLAREYEQKTVDRPGLDGSLRLDYTPDGALYFVLDAGGGWATSPDPALAGWYTTVTGSIEYSY